MFVVMANEVNKAQPESSLPLGELELWVSDWMFDGPSAATNWL